MKPQCVWMAGMPHWLATSEASFRLRMRAWRVAGGMIPTVSGPLIKVEHSDSGTVLAKRSGFDLVLRHSVLQ